MSHNYRFHLLDYAIPVNVSFRIARTGDPYVWKKIIVLLSNSGEMTTLCGFLNCTSNPRERFGGQSFSFELVNHDPGKRKYTGVTF